MRSLSAALLAAPIDPESHTGRDASLALGNRSAVFFETGCHAGILDGAVAIPLSDCKITICHSI